MWSLLCVNIAKGEKKKIFLYKWWRNKWLSSKEHWCNISQVMLDLKYPFRSKCDLNGHFYYRWICKWISCQPTGRENSYLVFVNVSENHWWAILIFYLSVNYHRQDLSFPEQWWSYFGNMPLRPESNMHSQSTLLNNE